MAFDLDGLYQVGPGGGGVRLWTYTTADAVADVNTEDYFVEAKDLVNLNDIIFVVSSTGTTPVVTITYFNQSDGTNVDVVAGNVLLATDAD